MLSLNRKPVQHVKTYLACNLEVNLSTQFGIIALFSSNFQNVNTFHPLFQKLEEIDVMCKLKTCSACQDLPSLQFGSESDYPMWSYCSFSSNFQNVNTFHPLFQNRC